IDRLISCRNRFRGHGGILPHSEYEAVLDEWFPVFEEVLAAFSYLADHELLALRDPPGEGTRACLLLRGPFGTYALIRRGVFGDAGDVVLVHPRSSLMLDMQPFIQYHTCDTC